MPIPTAARAGCWTRTTRRTRRGPNATGAKPRAPCRSAAERRNIGVNSGSDLALKVSMRLARRAEAIEENMRPAHREKNAAVRLASSGTHAKVLIGLDDVTVRRPDGAALFRTGKLELKRGERLLLLGENGVGKSAAGAAAAAGGDGGRRGGHPVSPSVVMGYLDQQMAHLPAGDTPHGFIGGSARTTGAPPACWPAPGFRRINPGTQRRTIAELSPGERARLGLLALRLTEPNFYLLDEPTNHLDIPGQEQLEAEILAHEASAILVTHDRDASRGRSARGSWRSCAGG